MTTPNRTILFLVLLAIFIPATVAYQYECYLPHRCFSDAPPFDNTGGKIPQPPAKVGTKFFLFQPKDTHKRGTEISHIDVEPVNMAGMDKSLLLKVIVHGFVSSSKDPWVVSMKDAFISKLQCNVITVDWRDGAALDLGDIFSQLTEDYPYYSQSATNTRLVGNQIEMLLLMLEKRGQDLGKVHIIGHSLGAHVAGTAGSYLNGRLGRISGLDPAGLHFKNRSPEVRLDKTDAKFVDVIHTDSEVFGLWQDLGHVDFYPNSGEWQPGCRQMLETSQHVCHHSRAHELFIESIGHTAAPQTCRFGARPCESWDAFTKGNCTQCGVAGCSEMGFRAINHRASQGKKYLRTNDSPPFCQNLLPWQ